MACDHAPIATITTDILEDLATGATIFGTGGGGDPYLGKLMARQAIETFGPVDLLTIEQLPSEGLVLPVAFMGAPTVLVEKIPSGEELERVIRALERYLGQRVVALMPAEVGGLNSTIPVVAAAQLGLPLLDADGMGRAFPEVPMCSMNLARVSATPCAVADEKGNLAIFQTVSNAWTERLARTTTSAMGGSSIIAVYPMTIAQVASAVIPNTVSRAIAAGRTLRQAREHSLDPLLEVLRVTSGHKLFNGKVSDVLRRTEGGFVRGSVRILGLSQDAGSTMRLEFQNENLVAFRDGARVASVPDLITVFDSDTCTPITTEGLRYGARVDIVAMPCAAIWRTTPGLNVAGPRYFGYPFDYIPFEEVTANALPARN